MTTGPETEHVVLVDEADRVLGTAPKATVHGAATPLHRGFSLFVFDARGRLLLQQRARTKRTWPGVWSNSCCGHPALGETVAAAARRRARYELDLEIDDLRVVLPDFRYRAELDGIVENELCPVLVGRATGPAVPRSDEVEAIAWMDWREWVEVAQRDPQAWSPWAVLETRALVASEDFAGWRRASGFGEATPTSSQ